MSSNFIFLGDKCPNKQTHDPKYEANGSLLLLILPTFNFTPYGPRITYRS